MEASTDSTTKRNLVFVTIGIALMVLAFVFYLDKAKSQDAVFQGLIVLLAICAYWIVGALVMWRSHRSGHLSVSKGFLAATSLIMIALVIGRVSAPNSQIQELFQLGFALSLSGMILVTRLLAFLEELRHE